MFKLVAVAGKLRGEEFTLLEGENICGREEDLAVSLTVDGISKQHFSVSVKGRDSFFERFG